MVYIDYFSLIKQDIILSNNGKKVHVKVSLFYLISLYRLSTLLSSILKIDSSENRVERFCLMSG